MRLPLPLLLLLPLPQVLALQWPLSSLQSLFTAPLRVAVIGAGAGGSSAAFFLNRGAKRAGKEVRIDIYEKEDYVGGRSTTVYPFDDRTLAPVELGASVFVDANRHMVRSLAEWNLSTIPFDNVEYIGIWDGDKFAVIMRDEGATWWDQAKLVWRYGLLAPVRTQRLVKKLIARLLALYTADVPPFSSVASLSASLDFTPMTQADGKSFLARQGIRGLFPAELIDAATRVNYAQDVGQIHALGALVSMAASGTHSVKGGNWQVFERMVGESGAKLRLNTSVAEVVPKGSAWQVITSSGTKQTYDAVILAAPLHLSPYTLPPRISALIPTQPYVHLHVTLLVTSAPQARAEFFGLPEETTLPEMILTTSSVDKEKVGKFNSISYLGATRGGWVVKIFSMQELEDDWLEEVFGEGKVLWTYRKEWDAYPYLIPSPSPIYAPITLASGLYYVSALEPWVSTMETQTLAGRNVAELVLQGEWNVTGGRKCEDGEMRGWDC